MDKRERRHGPVGTGTLRWALELTGFSSPSKRNESSAKRVPLCSGSSVANRKAAESSDACARPHVRERVKQRNNNNTSPRSPYAPVYHACCP
jgi:hypothetical protein